ncbi:hypothetical protein Thal_0527 [Thermocrinis albus DSM 14484]|uniref:T2SS protein K second SAM-like domain-containing protein n=1 Tax=Thermocrinis albus (strain DSM 14484 / JCM 11386 / HI 11/12) TaxID=638303 RepID=D3SPS4_THEAH|nr:type II secretion system protein GspK [Thermocrinis albus]ADC89161.1 hypothetical protein Thal_0527 [Thermocrinis albus DSM 14484]
MILLLALAMFLTLSYYTADLYQDVNSTRRLVNSVYAKEQAVYLCGQIYPILRGILTEDDPSVDTLSDTWARPLTLATEKGDITISVYDEERYINLNTVPERVLKRLSVILNIDPSYWDRLLAWTGRKNITFDSAYPIKASPMDSLEELYYMGFNKEDLVGKTVGARFYPGILSVATVYSSGKINVNTAPLYVLMALDDRIDEDLARRIIERRDKEPFRRVEDLLLVEGFTLDILYSVRDLVDVKSNVFHIVVDVRTQEGSAVCEFIYNRQRDTLLYSTVY